MRLGFFGDVVGRVGRAAVSEHLPRVRKQLNLDFVVVNGENAAGGFGITASTAAERARSSSEMSWSRLAFPMTTSAPTMPSTCVSEA